MPKKTLVNVLGVVYAHIKTRDGGDLYLTRFAEKYEKHFDIENWYEKSWFNEYKMKLKGTGSVYRVPTKEVDGKSLDIVVKNCRVGEDVPIDTHTLQEFCDAEFNSPWEEFSLVVEMRENQYGPRDLKINTQRPMVIYVPPEKMQVWQSGRSKAKINRIRAKHPGIDLDILKQYKLIYEWIEGKNLLEVFEHVNVDDSALLHHLITINNKVISDLNKKGYLVADMKPEHIIISGNDTKRIEEIGCAQTSDCQKDQINYLYHLINTGNYSIVDYELLLRTLEHEEEVKHSRRHSYLDDQRDRFIPTPLPDYLSTMEIFGVPYIYGHAESTGGHLWVVGKNARLFDYFLPERWRKTPSIKLSDTKEIYYTITKDNIHLVWKTSRVGELPNEDEEKYQSKIREFGINSPFEEFAIAQTLNQLGIPCVYVRAIYMTGSAKIEASSDLRKYESHKNILDPEGNSILQENHNYITIRGYYNGPDYWVAEQTGLLYVPVDLFRAVKKGIIDESQCKMLLERVKENLKNVNYDGSLLKPNDLLLAIDRNGEIVGDNSGNTLVVICNLERIW
ncbi:MAG TPA: hypothetical protein VEF37_03300, partial [Thermodesulfovibrionales bacterium]|nr:hypothetical protein [Thermodesulfovibrionales bacterium]